MIYLLGMSHLITVLDACSINGWEGQKNKIYDGCEPSFVDWDVKAGMFSDRVKAASIYVSDTAPYWGPELAIQTEPTVISIAPGFQSLLHSIDADNGKSILFVFMNGEEYWNMSVKEHPVPHDFYMPWHPELLLSPQRQVIPLDVIERQLAFYLTKSLANFNAICSSLYGIRIFNVICPPPSPQDCLYIAGDKALKRTPEQLNDLIRLKYYRLYTETLIKTVALRGIESLMPPLETIRTDGMLKSEYVSDLFHANSLYGSKVVAQINELSLTRVR